MKGLTLFWVKPGDRRPKIFGDLMFVLVFLTFIDLQGQKKMCIKFQLFYFFSGGGGGKLKTKFGQKRNGSAVIAIATKYKAI